MRLRRTDGVDVTVAYSTFFFFLTHSLPFFWDSMLVLFLIPRVKPLPALLQKFLLFDKRCAGGRGQQGVMVRMLYLGI